MSRARKLFVATLFVLGPVAVLLLAAHHVERRSAELERELHLSPIPQYPEMYELLHARLIGADAYLDQRVRSIGLRAGPGMWDAEHRPELERGLASLGSFFEQIDTLLADCMSQCALRDDRIAAIDAPILGLSRQRTDVLCAQALVDLDRPDGARAAAVRLGQALDLIRLGEDGKVFGYFISMANESVVLTALQRVLSRTDVDRVVIREVLGDRLSRIAREDRLQSVLAFDFENRNERVRYEAQHHWPALPRLIGELVETNRLATYTEKAMALMRMSGEDACKQVDAAGGLSSYLEQESRVGDSEWLFAASKSHFFRAQRTLARTALDLAALPKESPATAESLPRDPFSGKPFGLKETPGSIELCADGALAALRIKPGEPGSDLLRWTIPR